ncbi:MAG: peptidoglycan-binding protein [Firmicutes bacterium]|nr:peptidoglycan-binding protein [Bacillota bacterium]
MVLTAPYVPESIVVHLGYPDAPAANVTVSFLDYIKNVASSEVYPTWPEAALRANIYAQISFTLNRIFTEWYRSQGYDFDITNTTQYDHAFIYERNIFDTISLLVDEIFTTYIREIGQVAPFPAPYCDGRQTFCDGMLQWGTVDLANQGYNSIEILRYYYGDNIELVPNAPVMSYTPSYPGTPLDYGDFNNNVLIIQYQLNRIGQNYPAIPKIAPAVGDFNLVTLAAVRRFQSIFNLAVTGIVDEATWYEISYIYSVVKRLAELETEGVEYSSVSKILPTELSLGATGSGVELLQYFLSVIGLFNDTFPQVAQTGVYDAQTQQAVEALQQNNGLPVTGAVDKTTWDLIYDQFRGITFILPALLTTLPIVPFDGVLLSRGSTGERVELLQQYLNEIAETYPEVPTVAVEGVFGPQTQQAVQAFQRQFGLAADGVVGAQTWQMILDVYESTLRRVNPDVPQYPGYPLLQGMSDSQ